MGAEFGGSNSSYDSYDIRQIIASKSHFRHLQTHMLWELSDMIHTHKNTEECRAYWILRRQPRLKGEREGNVEGKGCSVKAFSVPENMNFHTLSDGCCCKISSTECRGQDLELGKNQNKRDSCPGRTCPLGHTDLNEGAPVVFGWCPWVPATGFPFHSIKRFPAVSFQVVLCVWEAEKGLPDCIILQEDVTTPSTS